MAMDQRMALASSAVTSKPPLSELDRGRQTRGRTKWGETQTKSKNKREKNEGEQRGGGAHWCWHGREPRHFNALVRGNSFQWEFGLAFTSICSNTQFAKWFVEGEQKRSAVCLCTFSGGFRSSPLASAFLFFLGGVHVLVLPVPRLALRKWFIWTHVGRSLHFNSRGRFVWHFIEPLGRLRFALCENWTCCFWAGSTSKWCDLNKAFSEQCVSKHRHRMHTYFISCSDPN